MKRLLSKIVGSNRKKVDIINELDHEKDKVEESNLALPFLTVDTSNKKQEEGEAHWPETDPLDNPPAGLNSSVSFSSPRKSSSTTKSSLESCLSAPESESAQEVDGISNGNDSNDNDMHPKFDLCSLNLMNAESIRLSFNMLPIAAIMHSALELLGTYFLAFLLMSYFIIFFLDGVVLSLVVLYSLLYACVPSQPDMMSSFLLPVVVANEETTIFSAASKGTTPSVPNHLQSSSSEEEAYNPAVSAVWNIVHYIFLGLALDLCLCLPLWFEMCTLAYDVYFDIPVTINRNMLAFKEFYILPPQLSHVLFASYRHIIRCFIVLLCACVTFWNGALELDQKHNDVHYPILEYYITFFLIIGTVMEFFLRRCLLCRYEMI